MRKDKKLVILEKQKLKQSRVEEKKQADQKTEYK